MSTDFKIIREIVVDGVVFKNSLSEERRFSIYEYRRFGKYICTLLHNPEGQKTFDIFNVNGTEADGDSFIYFPAFKEDPTSEFQENRYWDEIIPREDHLELRSKNITYILRPENLRCFSEVRSNIPRVLNYRILERTKIEVQGQVHDLKYPIVRAAGFSDSGYIVQTDETLDYQNIYHFEANGNFKWRIPVRPLGRIRCESLAKEFPNDDYVYTGWRYSGHSKEHVGLSTWSRRHVSYEFNIETGILEFEIVHLRWHDERRPISHQDWLEILENPDL